MAAETDLFAPSFDPNDPASVAVWEAWKRRNLAMTRPLVEETRSPVAGVNTGDPRGMVDPEALRVHAQGGPYDMNARRNSIAATLRAQQAAAPQAAASNGGAGNLTYVGGGVYLPEFATSDPRTAAAINDPRFAPVQGYGGGGVGGSS